MVLALQLPVSLLVSTLRLTIQPPSSDGGDSVATREPPASTSPHTFYLFQLISPNRNLTFTLKNGTLFADLLSIAPLFSQQSGGPVIIGSPESGAIVKSHLSIRCLNDLSLEITLGSVSRIILSPSLCRTDTLCKIQFGSNENVTFNGCIENVAIGTNSILDRWCSNSENLRAQSDSPRSSTFSGVEHSFLAEPLRLDEGTNVTIQWENVNIFPDHSVPRSISENVIFKLVEHPQHGQILVDNRLADQFSYYDIVHSKVQYCHDGSETVSDNIDIEIEIEIKQKILRRLHGDVFSIPIRIDPVNDSPEIKAGPDSSHLVISGNYKLLMNSRVISIRDVDNDPDSVFVSIVAAHGVRLETSNGQTIRRFSQREFLNNMIQVAQTSESDHGSMKLIASDGHKQSEPIELLFRIVPVEIQLQHNTGLRVLYQTAEPITLANLSFTLTVPGIPIQYTIVEMPEFGVIECLDNISAQYRICSSFTQSDISQSHIRYRHSSNARTSTDSFSFQIHAANITSMVHLFNIWFIPVHVKIFNRITFLLNNTDQLGIGREHLFAWTFPKTYRTTELLYHIVEPPKFGTLSRRIDANRNRRIGFSSNFTQKHIDDGDLTYKLHFIQYTVVNDFFTFRLIAPSVTSEEMRFEITFIPGVGSIQLINRTVIVDEGGLQKISNELLSLETPDVKNFAFIIGVAPAFGNILVAQSGGKQKVLKVRDSFTTQEINAGSVCYQHFGGEDRTDRAYLIAESIQQRASRIPFWLTMRTIMKNDNRPRTTGDSVLQASFGFSGSDFLLAANFFRLIQNPDVAHQVIERGERTLHPELLPWIDDDIDAQPLQFSFHDGFRNAAIFTKLQPTIPIQNFTQRQMQNGEVFIKHFGHSRKFQMNYTVSDGLHEVPSTLTVIASEPFLHLEHHTVIEPSGLDDGSTLLPIGKQNLTVVTNLNVQHSKIIYKVLSANWILMVNTSETVVTEFTQQDIDEHKVFYRCMLNSASVPLEPITVSTHNLSVSKNLKRQRQPRHTLELRTLAPLVVPLSSISQIDQRVLLATAMNTPPSSIIYDVLKRPTYGSLVLETFEATRAITANNFHVSRFTQAHVNAGQLQYLHHGVKPSRDAIVFKISLENQMTQSIGPYSMFINIVDEQVTLWTRNMSVIAGATAVLDQSTVHAQSTHGNSLIIRLATKPSAGWLVQDVWHLGDIANIEHFTSDDLENRRIFYVNDASKHVDVDSFTIVACTVGFHLCTEPKQLFIAIRHTNMHEPELIRNEVLKIWNSNKAQITVQHLLSQDEDHPAQKLQYLISRPLNGYVALISDQKRAISNFTQADVNDSKVLFIKNKNSTNGGGFSFLLSDGQHQVGPEWFTVESVRHTSAALIANVRLVVAPGRIANSITMDLLNAHLPDAIPDDIVYTVVRPPKLGRILCSDNPVRQFSQADVNAGRLAYQPDTDFIDEWIKRDWFQFSLSSKADKTAFDEQYRFRISITYAALPAHRLHQYIQLNTVQISRGGSIAINSTHINLSKLLRNCPEELLLEITRSPHHGALEFLVSSNQSAVYNVRQVLTGSGLIYRHKNESGLLTDDIQLLLLSGNESNRRTNRLRITLPVEISPRIPSLYSVVALPEKIKIANGGDYFVVPNYFQVNHPQLKATAIMYHLIQRGQQSVQVLLNDQPSDAFSQDDVDKGKVHLHHQNRHATIGNPMDVLVFQVGDHVRALVIEIIPQSLSLINHSDIEYVQGKTYLILNRSHFETNLFGNDRSRVVYNITSPPRNGTFYWVAGEKEANSFTQHDIDEERVLYAQLNMQAFQDSFEFVVSSGRNDVIKNRSRVTVLPVMKPIDLIVEGNQVTPILPVNLDASSLEGSSPRFLVIDPPKLGQLIESTNPNESSIFFTFADVQNGRVFYVPSQRMFPVVDSVELQLDADGIQPARFRFNIQIHADTNADLQPQIASETQPAVIQQTLPISPKIPAITQVDYQFPVIVFLIVVSLTILVLVLRRHSTKQKRHRFIIEQKKTRDLIAKRASSNFETKADLLNSTVYATIGRPRMESADKPRPKLQPLRTFESSGSPQQRAVSQTTLHPVHSASPVSNRSLSHGLSGPIDSQTMAIRKSLDFGRQRIDRPLVTRLRENQYWV